MTDAILYAYLDPGPDRAADFYAWYERVIVPGRMAVPGFRRARRFQRRDRPSAGVMIYDVDDLDVLGSDAYGEVQAVTAEVTGERMGALERFDRVTARVVQSQGIVGDGAHVFVVAFPVPEEEAADLERWYAEEHGPMLLRASGWDGLRLFAVEDTNTEMTRIAVHELSDLAALDSPERAEAGGTTWRRSLADRRWFAANERFICDAVPNFAEPQAEARWPT